MSDTTIVIEIPRELAVAVMATLAGFNQPNAQIALKFAAVCGDAAREGMFAESLAKTRA